MSPSAETIARAIIEGSHQHVCPVCTKAWSCNGNETTWDLDDTDCRRFEEVTCEPCVRERQRRMLAAILCTDSNGDFFFHDSELEQLAGGDQFPEIKL